jgi:hypothetical protein
MTNPIFGVRSIPVLSFAQKDTDMSLATVQPLVTAEDLNAMPKNEFEYEIVDGVLLKMTSSTAAKSCPVSR